MLNGNFQVFMYLMYKYVHTPEIVNVLLNLISKLAGYSRYRKRFTPP